MLRPTNTPLCPLVKGTHSHTTHIYVLWAWFTKALRAQKRAQTVQRAQTHVEADLPTWRNEDCVCHSGKITRAIHLAPLPSWICNIGVPARTRKILGGVDANVIILRTQCDLPNLKRIAPSIFASVFSTFENQVLRVRSGHTRGNLMLRDCRHGPIWF